MCCTIEENKKSPDKLANQAATIHITVRRHAAMTIQIKHGKKY